MKNNKLILAILIVIIAISSYVLGAKSTSSSGSDLSNNYKDYRLLAKRLFVENPNEVRLNFNTLRQSIRKYVDENNLKGSIYFEYLPTGTSIRIDGDEEEVGASLIKLPLAMELYRAAEAGKINLDDKIKLKKEWLNDGFGNLYKKGAGYEISYRDLTKEMLSMSDNTALQALAASTEGLIPIEENPFQFLDTDFKQNPDYTVSISARSYSSFLKCLYFSCYINKANSQEILEYLTDSNFNTRLIAGIADKNVNVAHKIGNFSEINQSDCGIVYLDKRNYVICVMINGSDNSTTDNHIANISKLAFDYVISD